jgi:hypothetical protein
MAIRIRSRFHQGQRERSPGDLAGVVAMLAWKLAVESIKRMRRAEFDIDVGRPWYGFAVEFLVFLATVADRTAYRELDAAARMEFTTALVGRCGDFLADNAAMFAADLAAADCRREFCERFNARGGEYADFGCDGQGPDYAFRRYFAACLREVLPEKDRPWIMDQVIEIEIPDALKALDRTLAGLFHPDAGAPAPQQPITTIG